MRHYYRKKLDRILAMSPDEGFFQLAWAVHALQTDAPERAIRYLDAKFIPSKAVTPPRYSEYAIHEWELETLINELMIIPKMQVRQNKITRQMRMDHFGVMGNCINRLRKLEDVEHRVLKHREDVFVDLGRIAARQFEWQAGFNDIARFYRNAFVYGQGPCAAYFEKTYGITLDRFSEIGFILYSNFRLRAVAGYNNAWKKLGIEKEEFEKVLTLIALPYSKAAKQASRLRPKTVHVADRPSILRQFPCIRFGEECERLRAPLPELILERITSGVFYDVVKSTDGKIRDDYGRRFEDYCFKYLETTLDQFSWDREFKYSFRKNMVHTPDILCSSGGKIQIAFECKAKRMSQSAMFGINPLSDGGYQELAKAVFQLWAFFSRCRRGYIKRELKDDTVGVVLTLDNWLVMAESLRREVLSMAKSMAAEKDPEISEHDMKPIVFVTIQELERTLSTASEASFIQACHLENTRGFKGWRLDSIHRKITLGQGHPCRKNPVSAELGELLPWWDAMQAKIKRLLD
ncbi:hypothetical protein ABEB22_18485 (plasmid) [Thioclava sp. 'Guangxiensis']|uniref:hypothetical protein n=1 Tax=Thioclava sp. 'Guangxiensis' TaxID=3149044 RepID=UPI0032C46A4D